MAAPLQCKVVGAHTPSPPQPPPPLSMDSNISWNLVALDVLQLSEPTGPAVHHAGLQPLDLRLHVLPTPIKLLSVHQASYKHHACLRLPALHLQDLPRRGTCLCDHPPQTQSARQVRLRLLLRTSPLFALLRKQGSPQLEEASPQPALPQCPSLCKQPPTSSTIPPSSTHQIPPLSRQFVQSEAPDPGDYVRQDLSQPQTHTDTVLGSHMEKVLALEGDMVQPSFGLSPQDQQRLASEVNVVIHAAASISFDDHIHAALAHNYRVNVFPLQWHWHFCTIC